MTAQLREVNLLDPSTDDSSTSDGLNAPSRPSDFDAWVAARGPALVRFAHLVTGNLPDAQDVVQDALTAAYPRWRRLSERGQQEAYVRRSIVNGHISRWRSFGRRETVSADPVTARPPYTDSVGDHADRQADASVAWQLCQTLPRRQRAAVVLRFYEDLSFAEIGAILDCSEATARSHVHRALASLRDRLTETGEKP